MTAEIHQEVHCEFKTKDPHVEGKGPVDPPLVGAEVSIGLVDHAYPELAQNPDAGSGTPVDRHLHQRDEEKLRDEEHECAERHPRIEMDQISEHGRMLACSSGSETLSPTNPPIGSTSTMIIETAILAPPYQ